MRLIDADRFKNWIMDRYICFDHTLEDIDAQPTIDAIPVVQCKDCKHWHREIHDGIEYFNFSECDLNHYGDGHNFYCADAERKSG